MTLQVFLGTVDKIYILDKTENNPTQINGHPAWAAGMLPRPVLTLPLTAASEYDLVTNAGRPMDAMTNTFCAVGASFDASALWIRNSMSFMQGGNVLGNGTWLNVGGNQAVTYGGLVADSQFGGGPYDDPDGGQSYVCS